MNLENISKYMCLILRHKPETIGILWSQEDIQITESIGKAGSLIGVSLLDHLIIGEKNYTSLREIQAVTFE